MVESRTPKNVELCLKFGAVLIQPRYFATEGNTID
jgi:hypothetical protein